MLADGLLTKVNAFSAFFIGFGEGVNMGVRVATKKTKNTSVKEKSLALAQLALDIFIDKKQCVATKSGQNHANHKRKT